MNAGRVTRSCIVCASWQSTHATGCVTSRRASWYVSLLTLSKPATRFPRPSRTYVAYIDAWQLRQVPGCCVACWRRVNSWSMST
jgi:hypothetical protein